MNRLFGGRPRYYILGPDGRTPVPVGDVATCMQWLQDHSTIVRETRVGPARVTTVFLGIDHAYSDTGPPVLFETMIFVATHATTEGRGEKAIHFQERYVTWDEAETRHREIVADLRARLP